MPLQVTGSNFDAEVVKSELPVVIDFWAPWCGPCRMMSPVVDELAEELKGKVKVAKVNTDEEPDLAASFGVMSIPTIALVKQGKAVATSVGAKPKEALLSALGL